MQVEAWLYWGWMDIGMVVTELKRLGPYWERKGGADHIFVVSADPGRCQVRGWAPTGSAREGPTTSL